MVPKCIGTSELSNLAPFDLLGDSKSGSGVWFFYLNDVIIRRVMYILKIDENLLLGLMTRGPFIIDQIRVFVKMKYV